MLQHIIFFQNIMFSVKGIQFLKESYNKEYYKELRYLRSLNDEFAIQEERLNEFIKYIQKNSSYFNRSLSHLPDNITLNNLEEIPIMNKEIIRNNVDSIGTRKYKILKITNRWHYW